MRDTSRQTAYSIRLYDLLEANDFDGMQALSRATRNVTALEVAPG